MIDTVLKACGHSPQRRSRVFYGGGVRGRTMQDQKMVFGPFV